MRPSSALDLSAIKLLNVEFNSCSRRNLMSSGTSSGSDLAALVLPRSLYANKYAVSYTTSFSKSTVSACSASVVSPQNPEMKSLEMPTFGTKARMCFTSSE
eukprot:CAMPEP_0114240684 /NCGR_PEP_ID=MMETSP0058-20121206/9225_1 /TAXON_ID=36894 /ORGANISM="Pyramimonas parkeae, CCMP726" /LENGTH=100 /DNA_ID=CAMNT_0001353149 /DNA_START=481 /DNA_END=783 /DNA_ORIENTATION=+